MPCHLEIALSGLKARSVLSDRNTLRFSFSSIKRLNMDTCVWEKHNLDPNIVH